MFGPTNYSMEDFGLVTFFPGHTPIRPNAAFEGFPEHPTSGISRESLNVTYGAFRALWIEKRGVHQIEVLSNEVLTLLIMSLLLYLFQHVLVTTGNHLNK